MPDPGHPQAPASEAAVTDVLRAGELLRVLRAFKKGDFTARLSLEHAGVAGEIAEAVNDVIELNARMADELGRIHRVVGKEGRLGQRVSLGDVRGGWATCVDSVNELIGDLIRPTTEVGRVIGAVAAGDLSQTMRLDTDGRPLQGEFLRTAQVVNGMVEQLGSFASEVTRVAREVGTEGKLGGQAAVEGVAGTWKDLTDNVNSMASNLTNQVRGIAKVVTAVANGDLKRKLALEARGEIAELAETINSMTDILAIFADQVTTVAREVGVEGKLGGQAKVPGAAGTWRDLTDNVNQLSVTLTTQVRAIADVATAVTNGDLTRSITVEASGEVAALKSYINEMIRNLKDTTQKTTEQDWLKTNLAKFTRMMQGQRDLATVAQQILSELAPLVQAQHGVFYLAQRDTLGLDVSLKLLASYAYREREGVPARFRLGEGLVGQCAFEKRKIVVTDVPGDYIQIGSGLGEASPLGIVILPVIFEGQVNAVIELASFHRLSEIHEVFLDQLTESIGIVVNTIAAGMQTESLLTQSQSLTQELQSQQEELRRTNDQLGEKAKLLEIKNREVELAKEELEEKAEQLALTSKYKSEFLANMSHELRTPLNSLLILSKMLSDNTDKNLHPKQVDFARTIHASGADLLALIEDILDLSKIESGTISVDATEVQFMDLRDYVEQTFRHVAAQKGLQFEIQVDPGLPRSIKTDPKRLQQVLKNLLSNAFKFTENGKVTLSTRVVTEGWSRDHEILGRADLVAAFSVTDTGIGIPREKQKIIFEAFQQADGTTSRRFGGTGLGLSISREIARLLGGEIRVTSTPGQGSTFTLYLPRTYHQVPVIQAPPRPIEVIDLVPSSGGIEVAPYRIERDRTRDLPPPPSLPSIDDREQIRPGDRVLLIIEDDVVFARIVLETAHQVGFKGVIASQGDLGLSLARTLRPNAITLDLRLPDLDGWVVLDQLKHDSATRHIPVEIISGEDQRRRGLRMGAVGCLAKPIKHEELQAALAQLNRVAEHPVKNLLLVEDDERQRDSIMALIGNSDVETTAVGSGAEALAALDQRPYACMVVDLGLPDMSGLQLLETIKASPDFSELPIIVYTGKELSRKEETELRRLAETIILKDVKSPERLLDETSIYLHRSNGSLPEEQQQVLRDLRNAVPTLAGATVLVVDDDVRNIFAITSVLEHHQAKVLYAENGKDGLELLERSPEIDVVLMDVMMPEMDGYEVMRRIRLQPRFKNLPVLAVTAKAMRADRDKCLQAGASDYIAKPVDMDKLLSILRVWLER